MASSKLTSPPRPAAIRALRAVYRVSASLGLAVLLISTSAVLLAWATFIEREYGAKAVHFGVYGAWWFAALVSLLGLNVLGAALVRFPWKKYQTGFVITHAGILVLLLGCGLSWMGGIDAQMPIFEQTAAHRAFVDTQHFELAVYRSPGTASPEIVKIPFSPGPFNWDDYRRKRLGLFPWRFRRRDEGVLYDRDGVRLEALDYLSDSKPVPAPPLKLHVRRALVRLTVDGASEQFWLDGMEPAQFEIPPRDTQRKVVCAGPRRAALTLSYDEIDLGFRIRLLSFNRRLDPGTSMASHYSSLVDFLAYDEKTDDNTAAAVSAESNSGAKALRKNVPITLNEPVNFSDPRTGRSYRLFQESFAGPWKPGGEPFDLMVPPGSTKDQLFVSFLTVNYDPGRGLKYTGSLLIVAGVAVMFSMRAYFFRRRRGTG